MRILPFLLLSLPSLAAELTKDSLVNPASLEIPGQYQQKVEQRLNKLDDKIDAANDRALTLFRKQQEKITRKLSKLDSVAGRKLAADIEQKYAALSSRLAQPQQLTQYFPYLDTLKTSLKFLNKFGTDQSSLKGIGTEKLSSLESQLQKAQVMKDFLRQQQSNLKEQLQQFGFVRELKKFNKDVYYYGQQINEYREALKDSKKLERKAVELLSRTTIFQEFMQRNSMLAALFRTSSANQNEPGIVENLVGLQTRTQVNQSIQTLVGPGGQQAICKGNRCL
jgi:hypothetical protein